MVFERIHPKFFTKMMLNSLRLFKSITLRDHMEAGKVANQAKGIATADTKPGFPTKYPTATPNPPITIAIKRVQTIDRQVKDHQRESSLTKLTNALVWLECP